MPETRTDLEPPTEVVPRAGRVNVDQLYQPPRQSFAVSERVPRRRERNWRDRRDIALLVFILLLIANVTVFDVLIYTHLRGFH